MKPPYLSKCDPLGYFRYITLSNSDVGPSRIEAKGFRPRLSQLLRQSKKLTLPSYEQLFDHFKLCELQGQMAYNLNQ